MGSWDIGPFDNDTAADWCGGLDDAAADARHGIVREALAGAAGSTGHLDADEAQEALAAAALVAAQCPGGAPADPHYGPREALPALGDLRPLALAALDRVLSEPSELVELWDESDEGGPWKERLEQLRTALAPRPAGEPVGRG
ncbi:DUF4259 domain-containing protein [Streptomyces sp. NPDC004111]|uniref:DUF4259 domain-containing protein n=1 Tax=Streptomyces sp. NPDC004111 TaxID=3364690 RepID=UPI0036CC6EA5